MRKHIDEKIRKMSKVVIKSAADYLGISANMLSNVFAIRSEDTI